MIETGLLLIQTGMLLIQAGAPTPDPAATALVGAVFFAVGLPAVPLARAVARQLWPEREPLRVRWGFAHLVLLLLVAFAASLGVALVWPMPAEGELGLLETFARMGLMYAILGLAIVRVSARLEPDPRRALGWPAGGHLRAIGVGVAVYLMLLPALLGLTFLWPSFLQLVGVETAPQDVMLGFLELRGGALALALVAGTLVMPFFEELVFRGFLQPLLAQTFRERAGVVLTSLVFGALHGLTAFLPIFALSLILGGVMLRTRRFSSAWAVHALHNGLMLAMALLLPELAQASGESGILALCMPR